MTDEISLETSEEVVVLRVKDEKILLRINEENITLKVSGQGPAGTPGATPVSCRKVSTQGLVDTYRLLMSDGTAYYFEVTNGSPGPKGDKGDPGKDGANGGGSAAVDDETLIFTPEVENYEGSQLVIPTTADQTLQTNMKFVVGDVTVKEIPFQETSNLSGGYTATIGG